LSTKEIYAIFALILGQPALASEGCFAFLLFLYNQTSHVPVGFYHDEIDRTIGVTPSLKDNILHLGIKILSENFPVFSND